MKVVGYFIEMQLAPGCHLYFAWVKCRCGVVTDTWSLSGSVYSSAPVADGCFPALLDWG